MPEEEEREKLAKVIRQWNNSRLDLFEISQPDGNLQFHGVMRFYLEDHVEGNVATKCLRVCSNSPTGEVIDTLSEKFRPDMKMLTTSYSLYEIHTNKERKLALDEKPLLVQLSWNSDNKEGRFVLRKDKNNMETQSCHEKDKGGVIQNFKRTLSKKGKKKEKDGNKAGDTLSEDENGSTEGPVKDGCLSDNETQKICPGKKRPQKAVDQHGLPVGVKFCDDSEEPFLSAVINYTNSSTVHFKLSPAYILYAAGRFALRRHYGRDSPPTGRLHRVTSISGKMVAMTGKVIQKQQTIAGALAFWLANSSELLNFLKHDEDLGPLTQQSQMELSRLVHRAYSFLLQCLQNELRKHMPTFLIDPERHGPLPPGIEMVLNTLMNAMSLLRRCRVNPALTIQLFSQLFHFISAWLFNQLMNPDERAPGLRSHYWGAALRQRLSAIEAWAERQGLELAADCHLGHIIQATTLLTMNKYSMQDTKDVQSTCFKLNSLQLQSLLSSYLYATNEPHIPAGLIDAVVTAAEASADNLIRSEGRDIQLEESLDLHLPFLLPEGGYSCDTVRGIPPGFREFLEPICQKGLCSLTVPHNSKGDWTMYFSESAPFEQNINLAAHKQPEIVTITLNKPLNSGMGISIVAAKGAGQGNLGIYIKSVVKGGPAEMNGMLTAGDQLLSVDGQSLIGVSQERAAAIMMQTGPVVTLRVEKFGASYHGLGALLRESASQRNTGERGQTKLNGQTLELNDNMDPAPPEQFLRSSKTKKEQMMQRNRQLYRSNPNMTNFGPEEEDEPVDPVVRGNIASVSSINLYTEKFHQGYLTLPNTKSLDNKRSESTKLQQTFKVFLGPSERSNSSKRTFMRQALSQENLCMESGRPLLDIKQNTWQNMDPSAKPTASHYSSFPIRSSVSTHDILSDNNPSTKQNHSERMSCAGVWRTPFLQHSTPTPSIQPIRIDIPVTRVVNTRTNPPLTTFQHGSCLLASKMSQNLDLNGHKPSPQSQVDHAHTCPISAVKKMPQSSQQQKSNIHTDAAAKAHMSTGPTKHVSFQEPPLHQRMSTGAAKVNPPLVLGDPWRREAQEKLEEQQRLHMVELLQQEVHDLQAKAKRTTEENDRLRKLNLEWQFQKRLREIQQRGEDEDEEYDDLDMMVTLQQLEKRAQTMNKMHLGVDENSEEKELDEHERTHLSQKRDKAIDQKPNLLSDNVHNKSPKENPEEKPKWTQAPEKLTFKERQRLFSLASSA